MRTERRSEGEGDGEEEEVLGREEEGGSGSHGEVGGRKVTARG